MPVFRATAGSWARAKDLAYEAKFDPYDAASAATSAAKNPAFHVPDTAAECAIRSATHAARAASNPATPFLSFAAFEAALAGDYAAASDAAPWSAVSIDATRVEEGTVAADIAGSPLWPQGQPDQLHSLWQEMKAALHAAKQNWDVWTDWYDDRLEGRLKRRDTRTHLCADRGHPMEPRPGNRQRRDQTDD